MCCNRAKSRALWGAQGEKPEESGKAFGELLWKRGEALEQPVRGVLWAETTPARCARARWTNEAAPGRPPGRAPGRASPEAEAEGPEGGRSEPHHCSQGQALIFRSL